MMLATGKQKQNIEYFQALMQADTLLDAAKSTVKLNN